MADYVQVSTAVATRDAATELAGSAVKARLAASAQVVGPVGSVFWHQGEFGVGEEWLVLLKTTADRFPALEAHLVERHPWSNPEVTAVPIMAGSAPYLAWLGNTVSD